MADFQRGLGDELKENLRIQPLFIEHLKKDISNNKIFFAIRNKYASFYHKGCSLFSYGKMGHYFSTHHKFAFVPKKITKSYITEAQLQCLEVETSFKKGYEKIKTQSELYANIEAEGVSALYKFAPTRENKHNRYFLVDIEIAFDARYDAIEQYEEEKNDAGKIKKIDILLYDNDDRELLFCEAKHFSNKDIWAREEEKPKVIEQLNSYNNQISMHKDNIVKEYTNAFIEYNDLIDSKLNPPESVYEKCGLLVFGFDSWQIGKIKKLLIKDNSLEGHKSKFIGNIIKYEDIAKIYEELK